MEQNTPQKVESKIRSFQSAIRKETIEGLKSFVASCGGRVAIKEDSRWGYPSIYNEDAHVSIMGLQALQLNSRGVLSVVADLKTNSLSKLPIEVLLQLWDVAIHQKA